MSEARQPLTSGRKRFTSRVRPNEDQQSRRLRLVAKLRLGEKKTNGSAEYPTETDYFKLDVEEWLPLDMKKELEERFESAYGKRPTVIRRVYFISPDREEVFSSDFEMWGGGKLLCHGDGEQAQRRIDDQRRIQPAWRDYGPCANANCPDYLSGKCGPMNRLRFMVPEVTLAGFIQMDTGSWNSAENIDSGLNLIEVLTTQIFGEPRITGIPLVLSRAPQKIEHQGKLNTHWLVSLTMEATNFDSLRKQVSAGSPRPVAQITAGEAITMEIADDENDMPKEHVASTAQAASADASVLAEIGQLFDALNTTPANRAVKMQEYAGRESALRDRLTLIVKCNDLFGILGTPKAERAARLTAFKDNETALLRELNSDIDRQQVEEVV